ncbi:MAG: cysI [Chitinophagaceae bacterium]|nr:cysI [Chitinophagaceae bacterium]
MELKVENKALSDAAREDIAELEQKIKAFRNLQLDDDKFRAFRLTRGVYGQRQQGVQMIRIKLPYGKVSPEQLVRIADVSDKYASSNLHLTTRQDVQIHYVKLEDTPKVWEELEQLGITLREACGNTVRNITASAYAGIDAHEKFDVTPYAHAMFEYFLRNPVCQEMGRKFKIAYSSSEKDDSAFTFIHDLGFIPRMKEINGKQVRGFKVVIGGGLGAQPFLAQTAYEFLEEDRIIPFTAAVIRVFDRYGERSKRHKARLKYLLAAVGLEELMRLVEEEKNGLAEQSVIIDYKSFAFTPAPAKKAFGEVMPVDEVKYQTWLKTNVIAQQQEGFHAVNVKQLLGDLSSANTRVFASIIKKYASDDVRITVNQGWLLKFIQKEALTHLFNELNAIGLADPGFDSTADITACPGTDTCNLGISSSTGLSEELEKMLKEEYPDIVYNTDIKIKISGCMNACGQHTIANIGFHGMSIKKGNQVLPAMQVLLGGGIEADGSGSIADKVVKLPSKRCLEGVRYLLDDYDENGLEDERYNVYYRRKIAEDKMYFYKMLKPLSDLETLGDTDFIDWGHDDKYVTEVGVGECAGVMLDLVGTLLNETEDKLRWATRLYDKGTYADAIYATYVTFVSGAKALLTLENINCNTQIGIINDFDKYMVQAGKISFNGSFAEELLSINKHTPTKDFATQFLSKALIFVDQIKSFRKDTVAVN